MQSATSKIAFFTPFGGQTPGAEKESALQLGTSLAIGTLSIFFGRRVLRLTGSPAELSKPIKAFIEAGNNADVVSLEAICC